MFCINWLMDGWVGSSNCDFLLFALALMSFVCDGRAGGISCPTDPSSYELIIAHPKRVLLFLMNNDDKRVCAPEEWLHALQGLFIRILIN